MRNIILVLLVLSLTAVRAQSSAEFTLSRCIDLALQNSYRLQADSAQIQSAQALFHQEKSGYLPQVYARISHDQLFYQPYNFRQQLAALTMSWSAGDWLMNSARSQESLLRARQSVRHQSRLSVIRRVAELYISILQKNVKLDLLNARKKLLEQHLQVSRALWQAGTRTQLDVLQTRSTLEELNEQVLSAQLERDNLKQTLARLMAIPDFHALRLRDFPNGKMFEENPLPTGEISRNPMLRALQFQYKARQLQLRRVKASLLPRLEFQGGYQVDRDPTADGNYWMVGVGLQMPLFQWGRSRYQRQQIRADAVTIARQTDQVRRQLQIEAAQITERLTKLKEILQLQRQRLEISNQVLQYATANYQAGLITNLEYLSVQQALTENQLHLSETRLNYIRNLIELYTLTNEPARIRALQNE